MTARMKLPMAKEPKLYLKAHQKPLHKLNLPLFSCDEVKYQADTPTIME
jgi:hypothetical protein